MQLNPKLQELCLHLLDVERVPVISKDMRYLIVAFLHAQAKLIMQQDIPVLTQVIELGPGINRDVLLLEQDVND